MFEKLAAVERRLEEIEALLQDPTLYEDPKNAAKLLREQKDLLPVVGAYREHKKAKNNITQAQELMRESDDPELRAMAQAEIDDNLGLLITLENQIKTLLLPRDMDDDKNTIVEIRGGVGGEEAALFASDLFRMYSMYSETKRFSIEVMNINETELGGIKEISFLVEGKGAWAKFKYERWHTPGSACA